MLDRTIEVDDNLIDSKSSPFIIAEVGSNFNQNLDTAKQLIKMLVSQRQMLLNSNFLILRLFILKRMGYITYLNQSS